MSAIPPLSVPARCPIAVVVGVAVIVGGLISIGVASTRVRVAYGTIDVHGMRREYRMVTPRPAGTHERVPVVFALHGAIDTTDDMAAYTDLDQLAHEKGFLLVYLQGRHLSWPPFIPPDNPRLLEPDLDFFTAMCDLVVERHHADPRRIYLVGVSQGGAMANAVTAKCSERIAATVVACGWMPEPLDVEPLNTRYKSPILFVVGSRDRQVPPEDVRVGYDAFKREGHPVELCVVEGFGHGWAKSENGRVWAFLSGHQLPNVTRQ